MKGKQKIVAAEKINTKNHFAVGTEWLISGSKGDTYTVKMLDNGFTCNCAAFRRCKHINKVELGFLGV